MFKSLHNQSVQKESLKMMMKKSPVFHEQKAIPTALSMIESDDLKVRLMFHKDFLSRQEVNNLQNAVSLFSSHMTPHQLIMGSTIDNSILTVIVDAFKLLPVSRFTVKEQISEISSSEFTDGLSIIRWDFAKELSSVYCRSNLLYSVSLIHFSYALTLISARELLILCLESNRMVKHGESMNFEKFLNAVEMLAEEDHKDQPIEWLLRMS